MAILRVLYTGKILDDDDSNDASDILEIEHKSPSEVPNKSQKEVSSEYIGKLIKMFIVANRYCIAAMCDIAVTMTDSCLSVMRIEWCYLEVLSAAGPRDLRCGSFSLVRRQ